jgi:hypothetical protein
MTTNFFSPLSFVAVFGSGIRDPGSGMGKNQDPLRYQLFRRGFHLLKTSHKHAEMNFQVYCTFNFLLLD